MKKNKAFTLIELIAVLVILAIISLIVAPLILNIIRRVKDVANKRSVDGYGRAVEYAMASYQLEHLAYPDTFDKLEIEYKGNKVECKTNRINPDYSIYLSECKVNGRLVKDDKEIDGYYHYGVLKMTNQEYVDTYGKNLEDALKKYYDEHNEYPSDYTTLTLPPLDKEVSCDVDVNYDGTVYLNNCKVDNESVVDDNNEVYVYGNLYATTSLLKKTNSKSITTYTDGNKHEMYTFDHEATEQTPALTDYRYIGNEPYNYVKFNGDEIWRIIGVFDTEGEDIEWVNRIKIVKNENISDDMKWNENGENSWVEASINNNLNGYYYDGLDSNTKNMIAKTRYYLGSSLNAAGTSESIYKREHSNVIYTWMNDPVGRNWFGKIALMYPSDYVFTYSLGVDNLCYENITYGGCNNSPGKNGSWMYNSNNNLPQWLISSYSGNSKNAFYVTGSGFISSDSLNSLKSVKPVVYLKPEVKIKSGDGTIDNPYEFEL